MNPLPNSFGQPRSSNGYISSDNCLPQLRQQASWDITMSYPRTEPMKDWGFSGDLNPFILYPAIFTEHAQLIHFASASHWLSCWQHLKNLLSPKNWLIEIILSIRMSENILSPKTHCWNSAAAYNIYDWRSIAALYNIGDWLKLL